MLSRIPKIFNAPASNGCQEGKEGDSGRSAPTWIWLPLHIGEGLSFPKVVRVFLSPGLGAVPPLKLKCTMPGG